MDSAINLIYTANAVLCLLFGLHIISLARYRSVSTKILGVDYLIYALQYALGVSFLLWSWQPAFFIRPVIAMLIGPGYYFYYYSLVKPESLWRPAHFLHLIPALVMVYALFDKSSRIINIDYLILSSFSIYTLLVLTIIARGPSLLKHLGPVANNAFRWLCVLAVMIVIATATEFSIYFEMQDGTIIATSKSLLVGSFIFLIFNAANIFLSLRQAPIIDWMFVLIESSFGQYKNSELSDERRHDIYQRWQRLVEQQEIYKQEGGVTIREAAKMLDVPSRHLSESINSCFQGSFSQCLNHYRIQAAQKLLLEQPSIPITRLMFEVGFNSKSGFNKEFAKISGMSPTQYREKCLQK